MPSLLAIDPATTCGWAFTPSGRLRDAVTGTWKARKVEHEPHALASSHSEALARFLEENDVNYCLLEKPVSAVLKSIGAQNALWCLGGGLAAVLNHHGVPFRTVQPNEWRSAVFGTGGGRLNSAEAKRTAIQMARHKKIEVLNHDAAEAFCLLVYLAQHLKLWQIEDQVAA